MLIEGFMPKGVGFFGSLSGTGKTWIGLSVAKALTSGMPLWGVFPVKKPSAVLYLIPEASDASFKRRLGKMRITQDKHLFRYRTITQGITRPLSDPITVAMIQQLSVEHDVLVVVDTAVRFFRGGDENAAKENNLVQDSDMLRSIGANVLFLHHSPKATSPLESWPPTKVVPKSKMGATTGTSRAPQMQKWFPFPVSRTGTGPRMRSFLRRSGETIPGLCLFPPGNRSHGAESEIEAGAATYKGSREARNERSEDRGLDSSRNRRRRGNRGSDALDGPLDMYRRCSRRCGWRGCWLETVRPDHMGGLKSKRE